MIAAEVAILRSARLSSRLLEFFESLRWVLSSFRGNQIVVAALNSYEEGI